ncbi:unnamed protein product [Bursaphelenchus okinawaensis]|uniref:Tubby-like protein n=1 Tax=Bursaphelenchus okinawaensis TaxID=465554 RepID=A0A811KCK0_9BILA|nr:unnamed protein product [Bursaphelenchus okinawaensis]CAG9099031.1 unnamed protein product [Bursaphelenchus okinawaensis]
MSNDWVEHNLQRQRHLLEERQRQRRLQQNGIVASNVSREDSVDLDESNINSGSLYSFLEQDKPNHIPSSKSAGGISQGPKIITVRGLTPPPSQRAQSVSVDRKTKPTYSSSSSMSSDLVKPIIDVDRLDISASSDAISEGENDGSETVRPWEDDDNLETNVLEDTSVKLDIADIVNNMEKFVMEPCKKNLTMKCKITRDKKGVDKGMFPIYYLHLERDDSTGHNKNIFILAARRRKKSATANYLISTDATKLSRNGTAYIAKVRSNAVGTMFTIYDNGENPKKATVIGEGVRQELGAIIYETNVFGFKGPRKMTIILPALVNDNVRQEVRPVSEKDTILERFKSHRINDMVVLNNKDPQWNEDTQSYVLNFHGRVTQASVKNFQIVHGFNPDYVVMQFGRISSEVFTMDFRYPLSPIQAFGIAMSSFHGKLACE